VTEIGENYSQELLGKAPGPVGTTWHFLGAVQRNKVPSLAPVVDVWQSVAATGRRPADRAVRPGGHRAGPGRLQRPARPQRLLWRRRRRSW